MILGTVVAAAAFIEIRDTPLTRSNNSNFSICSIGATFTKLYI